MSAEEDMDSRMRDELMQEINLGLDAEVFLNSKVGRYLMERATQLAIAAMDGLKHCDPTDEKQIRALQNEVFRCESIPQWIDDAMQSGHRAEQQLTESQ